MNSFPIYEVVIFNNAGVVLDHQFYTDKSKAFNALWRWLQFHAQDNTDGNIRTEKTKEWCVQKFLRDGMKPRDLWFTGFVYGLNEGDSPFGDSGSAVAKEVR